MIALTRPVSRSINRCQLSHIEREPIDYERARDQHEVYEGLLSKLGCEIIRVARADELPDAVFVEDTAVVVDELAILTRPGASSRQKEVLAVGDALVDRRPIRRIERPGTLDGGDVMIHGRTVFVGRSARTNDHGIGQLRDLLAFYGYSVLPVEFRDCLHLKTAVSIVADDVVLLNPDWIGKTAIQPGAPFRVITGDPREPFAANALRLGGAVVHGVEHPRTRERLEQAGVTVIPVDLSELAKAEGGVTCSSIIFNALPLDVQLR